MHSGRASRAVVDRLHAGGLFTDPEKKPRKPQKPQKPQKPIDFMHSKQ
jgi:hypothetical protein